jgi:hypothetical protein
MSHRTGRERAGMTLAVAEVAGVVIYGPAEKLWQDAENLAFFHSMVGCSHTC